MQSWFRGQGSLRKKCIFWKTKVNWILFVNNISIHKKYILVGLLLWDSLLLRKNITNNSEFYSQKMHIKLGFFLKNYNAYLSTIAKCVIHKFWDNLKEKWKKERERKKVYFWSDWDIHINIYQFIFYYPSFYYFFCITILYTYIYILFWIIRFVFIILPRKLPAY